MDNQEQGTEARMTILEARLAFCEQRLAMMERSFGGIILSTRRRKPELTPEEKKAVRARLVAGQEAARVRREAEAKAQTQTQNEKSKKGATDGTSSTKS